MAKEIYVGHISENATEEDVRKLFGVMGTVTSVHLIVDPETKEFKRCGYVRMAAGVDLKEVVESLDGALLIDRVITVSIARPQVPGMSKSGNRPRGFGGAKRPGMGAQGGAAPKTGGGAKPYGTSKSTPGKKPTGPATSGQGRKPAGRPTGRKKS